MEALGPVASRTFECAALIVTGYSLRKAGIFLASDGEVGRSSLCCSACCTDVKPRGTDNDIHPPCADCIQAGQVPDPASCDPARMQHVRLLLPQTCGIALYTGSPGCIASILFWRKHS